MRRYRIKYNQIVWKIVKEIYEERIKQVRKTKPLFNYDKQCKDKPDT